LTALFTSVRFDPFGFSGRSRWLASFVSSRFGAGLGVSLGWTIVSSVAIATPCTQQLDQQVQAAMAEVSPRASWGIAIAPLQGTAIYRHDADQDLLPASNQKLLTTAAALLQLGETWRVATTVEWQADRLILHGAGDPSLSEADLVELADQVVAQVGTAGKSQIRRLVVDDSQFQGETIDPHWEWEDTQAGYGAPVNALIVDRNAIPFTLVPQAVGQPLAVQWERESDRGRWQVENRSLSVAPELTEWLNVGRDWRSGKIIIEGQLIAGAAPEPVAVSIPDPATYALTRFRQLLRDRGMAISAVDVQTTPSDASSDVSTSGVIVARVHSPTVAELVKETNQQSDNLYAETLLRLLGVNRPVQDFTSERSTRERGLTALRLTLAAIGVEPYQYNPQDGSGLSRQNSLSAAVLVQVLQGMVRSSVAQSFRASLPVAGESGTLTHWSGETVATVRAKTGSMTGVYALSGYLEQPDNPIVFSVLLNHSGVSYDSGRRAVAEVVEAIDQFSRCELPIATSF